MGKDSFINNVKCIICHCVSNENITIINDDSSYSAHFSFLPTQGRAESTTTGGILKIFSDFERGSKTPRFSSSEK